MGKLRIGIIGCGGIALQKHLPAMKSNSDLCEVVAFSDVSEERSKKACEEYGAAGARYYTDYHELLANPEVEVVHICTPNVFHSEMTVAAFEAKKHVYVEKPMSHSTEEAEKMMAAWKKSGMQFTIGYQNRFRPEVMNLHAACEAGDLGEIYYAKAHAVRRRAVPTWGVFPNKSLQGGGPLIDIGTHALDMTLWCMDNYDVETVSGQVFYKLNGALIILEAAWAINLLESREACTTLCGTLAGAEIRSGMSYTEPELIYNRARNGQLMQETISPAGPFAGKSGEEKSADCRQWLEAILKGTSPLVKPEQALMVTRILESIYRSAERKEEIRF